MMDVYFLWTDDGGGGPAVEYGRRHSSIAPRLARHRGRLGLVLLLLLVV